MIIIDRIEGTVAILEIGEALIEVPASLLPAGAQEGDPLVLSPASGDGLVTPGLQETVERVERLRASDPGDMDIDI
jgi:hypothetical protein